MCAVGGENRISREIRLAEPPPPRRGRRTVRRAWRAEGETRRGERKKGVTTRTEDRTNLTNRTSSIVLGSSIAATTVLLSRSIRISFVCARIEGRSHSSMMPFEHQFLTSGR